MQGSVELSVLEEVGASLGGQELLRWAASDLNKNLPVRVAALYGRDDARGRLLRHGGGGDSVLAACLPAEAPLDMSVDAVSACAHRSSPILIADPSSHPLCAGWGLPGPGSEGGALPLAALPIHHGGELEGVLVLLLEPGVDVEGSDSHLAQVAPTCAGLGALLSRNRAAEHSRRSADEARRRGEELALSRATLDSIFDGSDDGLVLTGGNGRILRANTIFADLLGLEPADLIGLETTALQRMMLARAEESSLKTSFGWVGPDDPSTVLGRFELVEPERHVLVMRSTPVRDPEHRVAGRLYVARDVTDEEMMSRMKTEFVATVSHELRTPLTSLHGALRIIENLSKEGGGGRSTDQFVDVAVRNTERLIRLLDDILEVERIESGHADIRPSRLEAGTIIGAALSEMQVFADERGVSLIVDCEDEIAFVADRDRLLQVLVNLLSNAIKFSPPNRSVRVSAREKEAAIRFSVRDRGPGVPPGDRERIFQKFQQLDGSTTRVEGGTGLGLAICKAIVEEHGGQIWCSGREGGGSTFTFQIPRLKRPFNRDTGKDLQRDDTATQDLDR